MQRRGPGRQRGDERRERAFLLLAVQKAALEGMSLFSLWSCYGRGAAFTSPGASLVYLCLCLRLLPWASACLLCASRAHVSSPIPHQDTQLLALLCSKVRSSLSPDKNCIARLLFHEQLPCIKGSLPHTAGAERGDPEAELSQAGVQPTQIALTGSA